MKMAVLVNLLAILPGLIICYYIYQLDKYERESKVELVICFVLGMLSTVPIYFLERWAHGVESSFASHTAVILFSSFFIVGFGEEFSKFIALLIYPFHRPFFNEPFDGIIYAVMISMGFATLENVLYANQYGLETTLLRAFTAVPAHAAFGVILGYYVGLARFNVEKRAWLLLRGLGVAVLVHGLYDFFILQQYIEWLMLLAVIVLWLALWYSNRLIKLHQRNSPFRPAAMEDTDNFAETDPDTDPDSSVPPPKEPTDL